MMPPVLRTEEHLRTLLVVMMLISLDGVAAGQSAAITGVVSHARQVVPGVTVTAVPQSGGLARHSTSGGDGTYRFEGLPEGTYRVNFEVRGFDLVRRNNVRVRRGAEARVDVALTVRAMCECIAVDPPSPWAQRVGQVIDRTGYPLPHARVELVGRQAMSTDAEGRFFIRLPVNEPWALRASDTGFRAVTQEFSGEDAAVVVLSLEYAGPAGVPDEERFGGCECDGYLRPYEPAGNP